MRLFVTLFCLMVMAAPVWAGEVAKKPTDKPEETLYATPECRGMMQQVQKDRKELGNCWKDGDCVSVSLGCPWQFSACDQTLISLTEQEKNLALVQKIREYKKECIDPYPEYLRLCSAFEESVKATGCRQLTAMCINGKCATQIDALMQDPDIGNKFDNGRIAPDDIIKKR